MKTSLARIFVQNPFCKGCISSLEKKVLQVDNVKHVRFFMKDSLIVFNFNRVNQVSEVMNILLTAGHPPQGDIVSNDFKINSHCNCIAKT